MVTPWWSQRFNEFNDDWPLDPADHLSHGKKWCHPFWTIGFEPSTRIARCWSLWTIISHTGHTYQDNVPLAITNLQSTVDHILSQYSPVSIITVIPVMTIVWDWSNYQNYESRSSVDHYISHANGPSEVILGCMAKARYPGEHPKSMTRGQSCCWDVHRVHLPICLIISWLYIYIYNMTHSQVMIYCLLLFINACCCRYLEGYPLAWFGVPP